MRMKNKAGEIVYYNPVTKRGRERFIVLAASGQVIRGRDGQKLKSRTFSQEHQAEAWLKRHGYEVDYSPWEK